MSLSLTLPVETVADCDAEPAAAHATAHQPLRGIVLFACGVLVLAGMDATTKYLAMRYEVPLVVGVRYVLFTAAHRYTAASTLAPIGYLQVVWAGLLGWIVFRHVPALASLIGMAIIVASGAQIALRSSERGAP